MRKASLFRVVSHGGKAVIMLHNTLDAFQTDSVNLRIFLFGVEQAVGQRQRRSITGIRYRDDHDLLGVASDRRQFDPFFFRGLCCFHCVRQQISVECRNAGSIHKGQAMLPNITFKRSPFLPAFFLKLQEHKVQDRIGAELDLLRRQKGIPQLHNIFRYGSSIGLHCQCMERAQVRNLREAHESLRKYIEADLQEMTAELEKMQSALRRMDEVQADNQFLVHELTIIKKRQLSFAEYAKDAQPDELVTLINTVVERIYITTEEDKRICHIFIKGCTTEDYTEIFGAADYIAHNAVQPVTAEAKMCDSEPYSFSIKVLDYLFFKYPISANISLISPNESDE